MKIIRCCYQTTDAIHPAAFHRLDAPAACYESQSALQAEPIYDDPFIPDEKARAARIAIQSNGAPSGPDMKSSAASNGLTDALPTATLESCLEDNCVVLSIDTPMQEALQVISCQNQQQLSV